MKCLHFKAPPPLPPFSFILLKIWFGPINSLIWLKIWREAISLSSAMAMLALLKKQVSPSLERFGVGAYYILLRVCFLSRETSLFERRELTYLSRFYLKRHSWNMVPHVSNRLVSRDEKQTLRLSHFHIYSRDWWRWWLGLRGKLYKTEHSYAVYTGPKVWDSSAIDK